MRNVLRLKSLLLATVTLSIALNTHAESNSKTTPMPANATAKSTQCDAPEYHQLDYWIGDWDTFETDDAKATSIARARVEPIAGGCALHELYEQNDGLIGDSILSYDPVRKKWQQTWVTNRGSIMMLLGNESANKMVLEGDVHMRDGKVVKQRITWEKRGKDVREYAVMSKDNGKTWTPAFDVIFRKRMSK